MDDAPNGPTLLYLEAVRMPRRWPWRDPGLVARVLGTLAKFHACHEQHHKAKLLPEWDYEAVIADGAARAIQNLDHLRRDPDLIALFKFRPPLERMAGAIGSARRALLGSTRLAPGPLHGDVHSGNVLLRSGPAGEEPVLIDWARARLGSPLEDVSSWLQSLSYWEPEAARRHDTLLSSYLAARGLPAAFLAELRPLYWVAAASNVLAGALAHHLAACAVHPPRSAGRVRSFWCARDCLRIIRRADALWIR